MAANVHKAIRNEDLKKILPVKQTIKLAKQVENNTYAFERDMVDGVTAIAENFCRMAEQWGEVCMPGAASCLEKNGKLLHAICHMSHKAVEDTHKAVSDLMQISREVMDCRSFDELYNLQRKAASVMENHWLAMLQQMNYEHERAAL